MIRKATQVHEDESPVVGWDIQPLSPDAPDAYLAGSMVGARAEPLALRVLGLRRGDVVMPPDCLEWAVVQRCRDRRRAGSRSVLYRSPGERRQLRRVALLSAMLVYLAGVTVPGVHFAELVVVAGVVFVTYCLQGALPASAATATDHALAELGRRTGPPVPLGDELAYTMRWAAQGLTPAGRRALHECVYLLLHPAHWICAGVTPTGLLEAVTHFAKATGCPADGIYAECVEALHFGDWRFVRLLIHRMRMERVEQVLQRAEGVRPKPGAVAAAVTARQRAAHDLLRARPSHRRHPKTLV